MEIAFSDYVFVLWAALVLYQLPGPTFIHVRVPALLHNAVNLIRDNFGLLFALFSIVFVVLLVRKGRSTWILE